LSELLLEQTVHPSDLLLFAQLNAEVGESSPPLTVLAGGIGSALYTAFCAEAAVAFQEELRTLSPA
jgi:hypothetical protein